MFKKGPSVYIARWLNPLLSLGSKRPLQAEDFYGLRSQDSTAVLGDQLQRYFLYTVIVNIIIITLFLNNAQLVLVLTRDIIP